MKMLTTLRLNFRCNTNTYTQLIKAAMKKGILFLLIAFSFTAKAQSLKDLLYSGKLRNDSNTVVRKTDDLKSKTDSTDRKAAAERAASQTVVAVIPGDSLKRGNLPADSNAAIATVKTGAPVEASQGIDSAGNAQPEVVTSPAPVKSNSKIWKEYTESLVTTLKAEVLSNKKVKKETYYVLADYEIGADGQATLINVTVSPDNAFLLEQVKQRLADNPPAFTPVMDSSNQPKKVKRKFNFYVTKE
jgi:hypothetical protein